MFEFLSKIVELIHELITYPIWKRKERFIRRQRIVSDVRFAINQWVRYRYQPEFKGETWWLEIRDYIDEDLRISLEMKRQDLDKTPYSLKHVPYERRIEALTSEIGRIARKWKVE